MVDLTWTSHSTQNLITIHRTHDNGHDTDYFTDALNCHYEHTVRGTTYILAGDLNAHLRPDNKTEQYLYTTYEIGFMCGTHKLSRALATVQHV